MNNAELIYSLRYCFEKRKTVVGVPWYVWCDRAADALEVDEQRIAELEAQEVPTVTRETAKKVTAKDAAESAAEVAMQIAQQAAEEKSVYCYPPIELLKLPGNGSADEQKAAAEAGCCQSGAAGVLPADVGKRSDQKALRGGKA